MKTQTHADKESWIDFLIVLVWFGLYVAAVCLIASLKRPHRDRLARCGTRSRGPHLPVGHKADAPNHGCE